MKIFAGIAFLVVVLGVIFGFMYISYSNQEVTVRSQVMAKQDANKVIFDKVRKIIQSHAKVADTHMKGFDSIYTKIMDKRYQDGDNLLFKFVTESNPNFTPELFVKLANSIESQRTEFAMVQVALIDLNREHGLLLTKIPSKWFLMGRKSIDIKLVTSTDTDKAFNTGKEDDLGF
jgi:uncharacterized membrane-anchored protein YhcB (DUF1043 family)